MGGGQSTGYMRDTMRLEMLRREGNFAHEVAGMAFDKCVDPDFVKSPTARLTAQEQQCVDAYCRMFANYAKSSHKTFSQQYSAYEHEMQTKAQQEAMAAARAQAGK